MLRMTQILPLTLWMLMCARVVSISLLVLYLMCCCSSGTISELMITPSHNITIDSGTTVSLNCTAKHTSDQDCSMCLVWKHNSMPLSSGDIQKMQNTESTSLIISASNHGNYSCQRKEVPFKAKSINITLAG